MPTLPPTAAVHPAFVRARELSEPLRLHFPKSVAEAQTWQPMVLRCALSTHVLAVARTRVECAWAAYIDAVEGEDHAREAARVLDYGTKLPEHIARALFPKFDEVSYAD